MPLPAVASLVLAVLPQEQPAAAPAALQPRTFAIAGTPRQALLHVPAQALHEPCPLVLVLHGHGGNAAAAARSFRLHEVWPEAVIAYLQGLPTPTPRDPDGERRGWQNRAGEQADRDLQFVDAVLDTLRSELRVDPHRIHATGHSNGGGFTYLLAASRGAVFASFAPSAAGAGALREPPAPARPILHLAGRADTVVPFANQRRAIDRLLAARGAAAAEPWPEVPGCVRHRAANGGDVAVFEHDGGHGFPAAGPEVIAAFLRATPLPNRWLPPLARGPGLVQHVYASPAAGTEVGYHVYLPPDYGQDPAQRWPVVYWLHGSGGGEPASVAARFDAAIQRGLMAPSLVVFPHGLPNGMWCDSHDGRTPVETVLVDEIVPRIDRLFRTDARREGRTLEGFSMGGYGALRLAIRHRDRFGAASSLAGGPLQQHFDHAPRAGEARRREVLASVYGDDPAVFAAQSPWQLAEQHRDALRSGLRLRLVIGTADATLPANRALHEHFVELGIPHDYVELDGVGHDVPDLLQALGARFWGFHSGTGR